MDLGSLCVTRVAKGLMWALVLSYRDVPWQALGLCTHICPSSLSSGSFLMWWPGCVVLPRLQLLASVLGQVLRAVTAGRCPRPLCSQPSLALSVGL